MITFIQLIMAVVITSLAFVFTMIGIQVMKTITDFRLTLKKLNRILDNTREISESVARPVTAVNRFFTDVKDLVNTTQDEIIEQTPDKVVQRFFHRSGTPLKPSN